MEPHVKVYFTYFGLTVGCYVGCEVCERPYSDIHHIECRGMGGKKTTKRGIDIDHISNLMAVCRECHVEYGDKEQYFVFLTRIHNLRLQIFHKDGRSPGEMVAYGNER